MTKRKNFYLIFKEAVNNALKYSDCSNLWVNIRYFNGRLQLLVRDDGKGFDPREAKAARTLSGNGLQNMKIRAREMKGSCDVISESGTGTRIDLQFPIP